MIEVKKFCNKCGQRLVALPVWNKVCFDAETGLRGVRVDAVCPNKRSRFDRHTRTPIDSVPKGVKYFFQEEWHSCWSGWKTVLYVDAAELPEPTRPGSLCGMSKLQFCKWLGAAFGAGFLFCLIAPWTLIAVIAFWVGVVGLVPGLYVLTQLWDRQ